ncbi:MAG: HAD hydrolase-like protein, partial [Planctomycetes bacterium]|nr:HAD hydrolase-like protein [Planctomycetota bacterium]
MPIPVTSRPERRAALIDLDGTLVDSRADIAASANHARAALGLAALPIAEIQSFVGDGAARLIERVTPGVSGDDRGRAVIAFHAHYAAHCCDATEAYPGAIAALARLSAAGWAVGVCTNKPLTYSERILAHCGLRVDGVRGGDRTRKPEPGQLQELIAAFASTPARTWMIGD